MACRSLTVHLVLALVLAATDEAQAGYFNYNLNGKVGAARNDAGELWICVVVDNEHIQCGFDSGAGFHWCASNTNVVPIWIGSNTNANHNEIYEVTTADIPTGSSPGIYLLPETHQVGFRDMMGFLTVRDKNTGVYKFMVLPLTNDDLGSEPDCMYQGYLRTPPDTDDFGHSPHLGPKMAIARGDGAKVYAFSVVPSSDTNSFGAAIAFWADTEGTGAANWLYSAGQMGVFFGHTFDDSPFAPVAGIRSDLEAGSTPLFVARDKSAYGTTAIGLMYCDNPANCTNQGPWSTAVSAQVLTTGMTAVNIGDNLAINDIVTQVSGGGDRIGNAIFTVAANGELVETRFKCTNNAGICNGGNGLTSVANHGNNGTALDYQTDSLSASWRVDGLGLKRAVAYARIGNTDADVVETDVVTAAASNWSNWVDGTSGFSGAGGDVFGGNHVTVRVSGSSQDETYGVCSHATGFPHVGGMIHAWAGALYDWYDY